MLRRTFILGAGLGSFADCSSGAAAADLILEQRAHRGKRWTACQVSMDTHPLRLCWGGQDGRPLRDFKRLEAYLGSQGKKLVLAMNAGMFEQDGSPVGWCVAEG